MIDVPRSTMKEIYIRYWGEGCGSITLARDYNLPHRVIQRILGVHTLTRSVGPNDLLKRAPVCSGVVPSIPST